MAQTLKSSLYDIFRFQKKVEHFVRSRKLNNNHYIELNVIIIFMQTVNGRTLRAQASSLQGFTQYELVS